MERPIIFSAPMVRAILEGRKTQTRRLLRRIDAANLRFLGCEEETGESDALIEYFEDGHSGPGWYAACGEYPEDGSHHIVCPYGQPGDRLWVRETLRLGDVDWTYAADGARIWLSMGDSRVSDMLAWAHHKEGRTCSPIHMPRWASRLTLEVEQVRVQRLQDISDSNALAEGAVGTGAFGSYRREFAAGWDHINGKRAPWSSDPWVWALTFRRVP